MSVCCFTSRDEICSAKETTLLLFVRERCGEEITAFSFGIVLDTVALPFVVLAQLFAHFD